MKLRIFMTFLTPLPWPCFLTCRMTKLMASGSLPGPPFVMAPSSQSEAPGPSSPLFLSLDTHPSESSSCHPSHLLRW